MEFECVQRAYGAGSPVRQRPFGNSRQVEETPFFVNAQLNAKQVRINTNKLLKRCGRDPTEVHLRAAR